MSSKVHVVLVAGLALAGLAIAQDRAELLATPKLVKDGKVPIFAELTAEQVASEVTVVAGRNYAWFGFNTPEIHLVLPSADNSVYAEVDFSDPTLLTADGVEVPYERELGLYDHTTHHTELRCASVDGGEPVVFARAIGTVTIRYPLELHTVSARRDGPPVDGLDVDIDGPFVTRRIRSGDEDLDAAAFTGIEGYRALDADGRPLDRVPSAQMSITDGVVTEVGSYWGEVEEVQLDVADEWATIRVSYELPSVPPLPKERAGIAPEDGNENPPTPGAEIDIEVIEEAAAPSGVAGSQGLTGEEALTQLRELGFPEPGGDLMVMSAVQGNQRAVELFLAAGTPIDFTTDDGRTALVSALMYGRFDLARFLVDAGADVNIADSNNATPLFYAAMNCTATDLVNALLTAGADPTPATRGATTALEMARTMGCVDNETAIREALGN